MKKRSTTFGILFVVAFASTAGVGCGGARPTVVTSAADISSEKPVVKTKDRRADGPLDLGPLPPADLEVLQQAVAFLDDGRISAGIRLMEPLLERHPRSMLVLHELALAYRRNSEPKKAVDLLLPFKDELPVLSLAGLGSALDEDGRPAEAIEILRFSISVFPASGLLHSELGVTLYRAGELAPAMEAFRRGMDAEPSWPTNYLHSANVYADSKERALGLIYGEMFRILEPTSPRSREMAKTLVKLYREAVEIQPNGKGGTDANVSLVPGPLRMGKDGGMALESAYERTMGPPLTIAHIQGISLDSLHKARVGFLGVLTDPKVKTADVLRESPLFMFHRALQLAGHFEAYNVWLLAPAFPHEAEVWSAMHAQQMTEMFRFLQTHPMVAPRESKEEGGGHA